MAGGSRSAIGLVALILLAPASLQGESVQEAFGVAAAAVEGRWTSIDRAPLGGGRPAAAYDSESDRIVLFGDDDGSGSDSETWAYDHNTNTWTQRSLPTSPPPVRSPALAYDSRADRIVLFGGVMWTGEVIPDVSLGETWSYDFNTDRWENRTRAGGPPPRHFSAMAYDAESDRTILFGGWMERRSPRVSAWLNDTWAYDYTANAWTNLTTSVRPPQIVFHSLSYRPLSDRVILVGAGASDIWSYDYNANAWTDRLSSGPPPFGNLAVYDSESDRIVSYGITEVPAPVGTPSPGTWVYDADANTWTRLGVLPNPSTRVGHAMAYDAESDRVILFGGLAGGSFSRDTWAYDVNGVAWKYLSPAPGPAPRDFHAMAYDTEFARIIMFGGAIGARSALNDTWSYDVDTYRWARLPSTQGPPGRWGHAMAYDSESRRTVLFGGTADPLRPSLNDTWLYALGTNSWTNSTPRVSPPPRWRPALAYDAESDRTILFGGQVGPREPSRLRDTWAYDLNTNRWANMTPPVSPSLGGVDLAVYDADADRVVLVIGTLGDLDETWTYDFNTNAWTNMSAGSAAMFAALGAVAYDAESGRVILFAGVTWSYVLGTNSWSQVETSEQPPGRFLHAMAYDSRSDRVVLFGGARATELSTVSDLNDTWLLEVPAAGPRASGVSVLDLVIYTTLIAAGVVAVYVALARRRQRERKPPAPPSSPPGD